MLSRFPGGSLFPVDMPDTTDYFAHIVHWLKQNPDCKEVLSYRVSDTPITMSRNRAVQAALENKVDFLLMLDNDMCPDMYIGQDPFAEPFLPPTLDFMLDRWDEGPHMVGAPYCGPPPIENVYVFQWATWETNSPNPDYRLEQFSREESARKIGFEKVAALPTGLILFDMRIFRDLLKPPYFYYEWKDGTESEKASTEDVTMTRDAGLAGAKIWCFWSAWAGHYKLKCVGRPKVLYSDQVGDQMRQAVLKDYKRADRIIIMGADGGNHIPAPLLEKSSVQNEVQSSDVGSPGPETCQEAFEGPCCSPSGD
jgi:hypothetical protein